MQNENSIRKTQDTPASKQKTEKKYDKDRIIGDYQKGLTLTQLKKKHGISTSYAHVILASANTLRSPSQAGLLSKSGQMEWHRLTKVGSYKKNGYKESSTRLISVPFAFLSQLNFEKNDAIQGKWVLRRNHLVLELRNAKEVGV